jgi:hypothetical protein
MTETSILLDPIYLIPDTVETNEELPEESIKFPKLFPTFGIESILFVVYPYAYDLLENDRIPEELLVR